MHPPCSARIQNAIDHANVISVMYRSNCDCGGFKHRDLDDTGGVVALAPGGQQRRTAVRPCICGAVVRELGTERHLPQHGFRLPTGVGDMVRNGDCADVPTARAQ